MLHLTYARLYPNVKMLVKGLYREISKKQLLILQYLEHLLHQWEGKDLSLPLLAQQKILGKQQLYVALPILGKKEIL